MNIQEATSKLIEIKKPRYITIEYITSVWSQDVIDEFFKYTKFSYDPTISERIYCIQRGITNHSICPSCQGPLLTTNFTASSIDTWMYLSGCCSKKCFSRMKGVWPPVSSYPVDYTKMKTYIDLGIRKCTVNAVCIYNMYRFIQDDTNININDVTSSSEAFYIIVNGIKEYPTCECGTLLVQAFL